MMDRGLPRYVIEHNFRQLKLMGELKWFLYYYPDGASDDELMEIAADPESFGEISVAFLGIMADIFQTDDLHNFLYKAVKNFTCIGGKIRNREGSE